MTMRCQSTVVIMALVGLALAGCGEQPSAKPIAVQPSGSQAPAPGAAPTPLPDGQPPPAPEPHRPVPGK
jgi:hypothetical protein